MQTRCPVCMRVYDTKFNTQQEAYDNKDREAIEQHITGICSTHCWNTVFNISDQVARGKEVVKR